MFRSVTCEEVAQAAVDPPAAPLVRRPPGGWGLPRCVELPRLQDGRASYGEPGVRRVRPEAGQPGLLNPWLIHRMSPL